MTSVIEDVARALCEEDCGHLGPAVVDASAHAYGSMAKAALRALLSGPVGDVLRMVQSAKKQRDKLIEAKQAEDNRGVRVAEAEFWRAREHSLAEDLIEALPSEITDMLEGK